MKLLLVRTYLKCIPNLGHFSYVSNVSVFWDLSRDLSSNNFPQKEGL